MRRIKRWNRHLKCHLCKTALDHEEFHLCEHCMEHGWEILEQKGEWSKLGRLASIYIEADLKNLKATAEYQRRFYDAAEIVINLLESRDFEWVEVRWSESGSCYLTARHSARNKTCKVRISNHDLPRGGWDLTGDLRIGHNPVDFTKLDRAIARCDPTTCEICDTDLAPDQTCLCASCRNNGFDRLLAERKTEEPMINPLYIAAVFDRMKQRSNSSTG